MHDLLTCVCYNLGFKVEHKTDQQYELWYNYNVIAQHFLKKDSRHVQSEVG